MNEILKIDPTFNKEMFITKVNNIFIMLHSAIMMEDINRVRHFISRDLEEVYEKKLKDLKDKNLRQMYDELNVKTTDIEDAKVVDDKMVINVLIVSRYMDYLIDRDTMDLVSGINSYRVEKKNYLVFEKKIITTTNKMDKKCPGCGANIDFNKNGKCVYCGTIFDTENYDWILTSIETSDV